MGKPSLFYLVYNDKEGSFVNVNKIERVTTDGAEGSIIWLKDQTKVASPISPRKILDKIRVIRRNLKEETDARKLKRIGKVGPSR
jgi:hypothetical protein